jgi:16S rRNA (guanine527-N7)-methyltransferase
MSLQSILANGLQAMRLEFPEPVQRKLLDYLALMAKWNKVHNLTAVRDQEDMVTLHLLDSLSVLHHVPAGELLDVGSGAGLPGIPLALANSGLQVTVLDSSHKKTSFMRQVKAELGITNLQVVCTRVEKYQPEHPFSAIISRAFSDLAELTGLTAHLLAPDGKWLAMKGVIPYEELSQLRGFSYEVIPLSVASLEAQRHLVVLKKETR